MFFLLSVSEKCLRNTVRCLQNTFIFFLFLISSFFKGVPHSLSLDRFLFCCCECVNRACQMFEKFRKCSQSCKCVCNVCENVRMVQKFVPKKLGRRFLCRYSHHTAAKMFAKMFYHFAIVQKCLQICKSVQKCLQKIFFKGGKNYFLFYLVGQQENLFCTILPPLAFSRQQRKKSGAVLWSVLSTVRVQQSFVRQYFVINTIL